MDVNGPLATAKYLCNSQTRPAPDEMFLFPAIKVNYKDRVSSSGVDAVSCPGQKAGKKSIKYPKRIIYGLW